MMRHQVVEGARSPCLVETPINDGGELKPADDLRLVIDVHARFGLACMMQLCDLVLVLGINGR